MSMPLKTFRNQLSYWQSYGQKYSVLFFYSQCPYLTGMATKGHYDMQFLKKTTGFL